MDLHILPANVQPFKGQNHAGDPLLRLPEDLDRRVSFRASAQDGHHMVRAGADGAEQLFGSRYSEKRFVERQLEGLALEKHCLHYCLGFDTGAWIRGILKRLPASGRLICVEPCPEQVFRLVAQVDVSDVLADQRLSLVLLDSPAKLRDLLAPLLGSLGRYQKVRFLAREGAFQPPGFDPAPWRAAVEEVIRFNAQVTMGNFGTFQHNAMNFYKNALIALRNHDWDPVFAALQGKPLVIVSVGPTLYPLLPQLRRLQRFCHIGCVDNILRELLAHDVRPDFVFQVTWNPRSLTFFNDLDIPRETTLVFSILANPEVVRRWPGQRLSYPHGLERVLFGEFLDKRLPPPLGINVGHFALHFAMLSGADPVHLVGQDNCFPMMSLYHPGAVDFLEIFPSTSRFWSAEKSEFARNVLNPMTVQVDGPDGAPVWTEKMWDLYRVNLGRHIEMHKAGRRLHHTSPHSLPFPGTTLASLAELAAELEGQARPKPAVVLSDRTVDGAALARMSERRLKDLRRYFRLLEESVLLAADLDTALAAPEKRAAAGLLERRFRESMSAFFACDAGWITAAVTELEKGLGQWMEMERDRLKEAQAGQDDHQRVGREFIREFHARSRDVHTLLRNFYTALREKAGEP